MWQKIIQWIAPYVIAELSKIAKEFLKEIYQDIKNYFARKKENAKNKVKAKRYENSSTSDAADDFNQLP